MSETKKTCGDGEDKCYKAAFPGGVTRGCAKERCNVQVSSFIYQYQIKGNMYFVD